MSGSAEQGARDMSEPVCSQAYTLLGIRERAASCTHTFYKRAGTHPQEFTPEVKTPVKTCLPAQILFLSASQVSTYSITDKIQKQELKG